MKKIEKLTQPMDASSNESLLLGKINELVKAVNDHEIIFHAPKQEEPKKWDMSKPRPDRYEKEEPRKEEINQCDGCRRGIPIKDGVHQGNSVWDLQACTKDKYKPSLAELLESVDLDYTKRNNKYYFGALSDEAKKAFEELINESVVLEILRNELISKIRRM